MKQCACNPGGTPKWVRDATANDSDKSFTVPTGKRWMLMLVRGILSTTATAGNRYLTMTISDGTNVVYAGPTTAAVVASKLAVMHAMGGSSYTATANYVIPESGYSPDVVVGGALPSPCFLSAGYVIRVCDIAAIDAAADDLTVVLHYVEYDV